mmetsp:Transcript_5164/g.13566  ORF Transcript_5164/g.13566 Transcript_5164/m.13566 type:complete len:214 (-) Transcript_5164:643-1284(-)
MRTRASSWTTASFASRYETTFRMHQKIQTSSTRAAPRASRLACIMCSSIMAAPSTSRLASISQCRHHRRCHLRPCHRLRTTIEWTMVLSALGCVSKCSTIRITSFGKCGPQIRGRVSNRAERAALRRNAITRSAFRTLRHTSGRQRTGWTATRIGTRAIKASWAYRARFPSLRVGRLRSWDSTKRSMASATTQRSTQRTTSILATLAIALTQT